MNNKEAIIAMLQGETVVTPDESLYKIDRDIVLSSMVGYECWYAGVTSIQEILSIANHTTYEIYIPPKEITRYVVPYGNTLFVISPDVDIHNKGVIHCGDIISCMNTNCDDCIFKGGIVINDGRLDIRPITWTNKEI